MVLLTDPGKPLREGRPRDPPEDRNVDDQGDDEERNVPEWLDIYFDELDTTIGADPRVVDAFGRRTRWNQLNSSFPDEPIKVYRGGQCA